MTDKDMEGVECPTCGMYNFHADWQRGWKKKKKELLKAGGKLVGFP